MVIALDVQIPQLASRAVSIAEELLGSSLVGAYLFGSAVVGGLRVDSDIDVLVIADQPVSAVVRQRLVSWLMEISGRIGNPDAARPLELTVVNLSAVVPWRYPPVNEFVYGEWLRQAFERHYVPEAEADPDLAIVLTKVRQDSIPLRGPEARQLLDPVPTTDLYRALSESLPNLVDAIEGDERNVLLTLARMWMTATTGQIVPKDMAAAWAIERLPPSLANIINVARRAYTGEIMDSWADKHDEVGHLIACMKQSIEACLAQSGVCKA